jgi:hypothetical protein
MSSGNIRKRLWINPAFQGRLLLHIGSYFLLYLAIICLLGFLLFLQEALMTKQFRGGVGLYAIYLTQLRPILFASAILMPYFIYDLIKFSNRVAGPLYRCQKMMREMAEGKPVREFQPRKFDLMPEFYADFNALIRTWNSRITSEANGPAQPRQDADAASVENAYDGVRRDQTPAQVG